MDTGKKIQDAIASVRRRKYILQQGAALYPTTGTGGDYPYTLNFNNNKKRKIYAFSVDTGK